MGLGCQKDFSVSFLYPQFSRVSAPQRGSLLSHCLASPTVQTAVAGSVVLASLVVGVEGWEWGSLVSGLSPSLG